MSTQGTVKVFIASPNDLAVERRAFKEVLEDLNQGYGRGAGVTFEPLGWEDTLATTGWRPQSVINQDVDACDVFVLVMWRRWGQKAKDATPPATSYTHEEYLRSLGRFEKGGKPTIYVFFKDVELGQMADPGKELKKWPAFRKKLAKSGKVLYRTFADAKAFRKEIDRHLTAFVGAPNDGDGADLTASGSMRAELDRYRAELQRALKELAQLRAEMKR